MFEAPDKRAIVILAVPIAIGIVNALVSPTSAAAIPVEMLLYIACIGAGAAFGVLDLREGYCLNRPSITREESPFLFWVEFLAACFLAGVGAYKLLHLI